MTLTPSTTREIPPAEAETSPERCSLLRAVGGDQCRRDASVTLKVKFPCGAAQERLSCAKHAAWVADDWLRHADHPDDAADIATLVDSTPLTVAPEGVAR
jgi:hypothetical protein